MRTAPSSLFQSNSITSVSRMTAAGATATVKATFSPPDGPIHRSPWHSPVPYLFGGLAAMLGLIAFALLVLACSYWKQSGGDDANRRTDLESGAGAEKGENSSDAKAPPVYEEKILVIMAGNVTPTFLATPVSSKSSSFNEETRETQNDVKKKDETSSDNGESC